MDEGEVQFVAERPLANPGSRQPTPQIHPPTMNMPRSVTPYPPGAMDGVIDLTADVDDDVVLLLFAIVVEDVIRDVELALLVALSGRADDAVLLVGEGVAAEETWASEIADDAVTGTYKRKSSHIGCPFWLLPQAAVLPSTRATRV